MKFYPGVEEALRKAFPEWRPLSEDGFFFLRVNYTVPVKLGASLWIRDPADNDRILYKRVTFELDDLHAAADIPTFVVDQFRNAPVTGPVLEAVQTEQS